MNIIIPAILLTMSLMFNVPGYAQEAGMTDAQKEGMTDVWFQEIRTQCLQRHGLSQEDQTGKLLNGQVILCVRDGFTDWVMKQLDHSLVFQAKEIYTYCHDANEKARGVCLRPFEAIVDQLAVPCRQAYAQDSVEVSRCRTAVRQKIADRFDAEIAAEGPAVLKVFGQVKIMLAVLPILIVVGFVYLFMDRN